MNARATLLLALSLPAVGLLSPGCRGLFADVACYRDADCPEALPACVVDDEGVGRCRAGPVGGKDAGEPEADAGAPGEDAGDVDAGDGGGPLDAGEDGGAGDAGGSDGGGLDAGEDGGALLPDAGPDGGAPCVPGEASHLVLNEVDYDQESNDPAEFIEILNPTCEPIPLADLDLVFINGNGDEAYLTVELQGAGAQLGPQQYLVVAEPGVAVAPGALTIELVNMEIQNGGDDGALLLDKVERRVIDSLTWEGPNVYAQLGELVISVTEGEISPFEEDVAVGPGSLVRFPDGRDTDETAADWAFTSTITPGARNVRTPLWPDSATVACSDGTEAIDCPQGDSPLAGQDGSTTRVAPRYDIRERVVQDLETGLLWYRDDPLELVPHATALGDCAFVDAEGRSDWRLANARELVTLLDLGRPGQKIDPALFGALPAGALLWSGTPDAVDGSYSWALEADSGFLEVYPESEVGIALCVAEAPTLPRMAFIEEGSSAALRDASTRLVWEVSRSSTPLPWSDALERCRTLDAGGFSDWRLPTAKELYSLVDFTASGPALLTVLFPGTPSSAFVTSTPVANDPAQVMAVDFTDGAGTTVPSATGAYVRCVRGGEAG